MTPQPSSLVEAPNVVGGRNRAGRPYAVINPASIRQTVGTAHEADAGLVDEAAQAAAAAAAAWGRLSLDERLSALRAGMDRVSQLGLEDELAPLLTREQGKTLAESRFEVGRAPAVLELFSGLAARVLEPAVLSDGLGLRRQLKVPVGPVAAITPWNWPVSLSMSKVVPALLAGNPVILKPAPNTPLTVSAIISALASGLPSGVLSLVNGGAEVGAALTSHPLIRKIVFVGSVASGKRVYQAAGANIKSLTLELGGNDPAVLLDDVDLDDATLARLMSAIFTTSGQVCFAVKRVYAPRSRYREIVEAISGAADRYVIGNGLDPGTTFGPVNNAQQLSTVRKLITQARSSGAAATELGRYAEGVDEADGYFQRPTVVSGIGNDAEIVQAEQFGPAIPVIAYDDERQAVDFANDTHYGLCASVWTSDDTRGFELAGHLEAGQVYVNCHAGAALDYTCPFGGVKESGLGRDMGEAGILAYTEPKILSNRIANR